MNTRIKWKQPQLLALIAVSALFSIGGVAVLFRGMEGDVLGGAIVLAIFVPATIVFARRLLASGPRLTLDDAGILDSRLGVGVVPWSALSDAYVYRMRRNVFLCLVPRDPAAWEARLSPLRRLMAIADRWLGAGALNVNLAGVDCVPEELEAEVKQRIAGAAPSG